MCGSVYGEGVRGQVAWCYTTAPRGLHCCPAALTSFDIHTYLIPLPFSRQDSDSILSCIRVYSVPWMLFIPAAEGGSHASTRHSGVNVKSSLFLSYRMIYSSDLSWSTCVSHGQSSTSDMTAALDVLGVICSGSKGVRKNFWPFGQPFLSASRGVRISCCAHETAKVLCAA